MCVPKQSADFICDTLVFFWYSFVAMYNPIRLLCINNNFMCDWIVISIICCACLHINLDVFVDVCNTDATVNICKSWWSYKKCKHID